MLDLRESSTYRVLRAEALEEGIEKGHTGGLREIILILGTDRFGVPDAKVKRKLSRITDVDYLNTLTRLILKVNSWDEWLAAA